MSDCIGCLFKQVFDSFSPIYFSCTHNEKISSVVKVRKMRLGVHYLILFSALVMLIGYVYLLSRNYCTTYTMKCVILLSEFNFSLIGFTILLFKLLRFSRIVLCLNGWLKLHENKGAFYIHYISLERKMKILKYNRIIFSTLVCSCLISETAITLLLVYSNDFLLMRLVLELLCSYFQIETYFENVQQITVFREIFKCSFISLKNNFLLALSPNDRFKYYKRIAFVYSVRKENSLFYGELQKMNRLCSAFSSNIEFVNTTFQPLGKFWFLEMTFHLVLNFYIMVNADYEYYKVKIIAMGFYIISAILFLSYMLILCDKFNEMVSTVLEIYL